MQVIDSEGLGLSLVGVGGITSAEHALELLAAGADVVQSATGMMWNPQLAGDFQEMYRGCKQGLVLELQQQAEQTKGGVLQEGGKLEQAA